jgi:hypothetical protein
VIQSTIPCAFLYALDHFAAAISIFSGQMTVFARKAAAFYALDPLNEFNQRIYLSERLSSRLQSTPLSLTMCFPWFYMGFFVFVSVKREEKHPCLIWLG